MPLHACHAGRRDVIWPFYPWLGHVCNAVLVLTSDIHLELSLLPLATVLPSDEPATEITPP
jgi:hypothetical protein